MARIRNELLDIVDENDVIVSQDTRENIHAKGLLHREIHVWFITPDGKMIFQHRAKDKDTYPDLLDATVGGHVDLGMNYGDTAVKETFEETGIHAGINDLHFLKKLRGRSEDRVTGKINNVFRTQYAYIFEGKVSDLKVEEGKAIGFEEWPLEKVLNLNGADKRKFIPMNYSSEFLDLFKQIKTLIAK
jgi:isopentenyldiphosphate isomerase